MWEIPWKSPYSHRMSSSLDLIRSAFSEMLQTRIATKAELQADGVPLDKPTSPVKLTVQDLFQLTYRVKGSPSDSSTILPGPDKAIGHVIIKFLQGNTFSVPIAEDTTIGCVQNAVAVHVDYRPEEIKLIYGGTPITDTPDIQLRERGISCNDVICLIVSPHEDSPIGGGSGSAYSLYIDIDLLHPSFDYDFTSLNDAGLTFFRGGYEYKRPCGWRRFALNVLRKYGGDDKWLGSTGKAGVGEWPVSYHGMQLASNSGSGGASDHETRRDRFGRGHYSSPNVLVAEKYGTRFTHGGVEYVMVLQNRVNPDTTKMIGKDVTRDLDEYWITANGEDIRAYGICVKKV